ncbi:MAG: V4R domain-containing protein [Candidatus Thorarchaeota archaeon]
MNEMIKTVYILHLDGIALLSMNPENPDQKESGSFTDLFGGFSSAINTLLVELGHKELKSITVEDGILAYSSQDPVLFVVHAVNPKFEQFAKLLVKQVEYEFFRFYDEKLKNREFFVNSDNFIPFESKIIELFSSLKKLQDQYPEILEFLPSFIPLSRLYEVLNIGLDIIYGYPDDTIKLVRHLSEYFDNDSGIEEVIAQTLGRYAGHRIAKSRFKKKIVLNPEEILDLLNEISVTKLDSNQEFFDVLLCPICRGKTSEKPICQFFSGFIEGALDNPGISVEETSCRALGANSCRFTLNRV